MVARIAVSVRHRTARIALLHAGTLTEYALWNLDHPDGLGDTYTARITARAPAMAGSFCDLGNGLTGFLPDTAAAANLPEGTYLTVTITRAAQSNKGPRLAATTEPPTPKPGLIRRGPSPLQDLAARFPAAPITIDDYAILADLRAALGPRITYAAETFDPILEDEIATLSLPTTTLSNGAIIHITPTPALTAIDIDSAATTTNHLALNIELIPALIRQITLRNLSGAIVIDFAGLKSRHRPKLTPALNHALALDPLPTKFHGFTPLGFAELSRPRLRPPLHEHEFPHP